MKIPDKASITLRKASEISMGAKKITHGWQFGIFSDDEVLSLTIFECGEPDGGMTIEIPQEFKCGRIFSLCWILAMRRLRQDLMVHAMP